AAHCLPFLPPAQSFFGSKERTYGPLLSPLGDQPLAWAVCRFVDPIADIAVLGSPGNPHADEYKALMETATALSIGGSPPNPVNFLVPARLPSLRGRRWFFSPGRPLLRPPLCAPPPPVDPGGNSRPPHRPPLGP